MKSPVLLIVFNRPETTKQVFEKIAANKPPKIYIAADGPREGNKKDLIGCKQVRDIVSNIDWDCEVKLNFHKNNLGCKLAVSSAINWFFDNEEEGIILEDDTVPHPDFFEYCKAMLEKYRDNNRVMMISGYNPLGKNLKSNSSFFSDNPAVWGWASWRRSWKSYDVDLKEWPNVIFKNYLYSKFPRFVARYYMDAFDSVREGIIDTWDYQLGYCIMSHQGLTLKPMANLIKNIGVVGAHSSMQDENHFVEFGAIDIKYLEYPNYVIPDVGMDNNFYNKYLKKMSLKFYISKLLKKLRLYNFIKDIYKKIQN